MTTSRFIPACAGNSPHDRGFGGLPPVHPRVCGEQAHARMINCMMGGSSPRVRGTAGSAGRRNGKTRFIPACAGNRKAAGLARSDVAVHPRVCGEQVFKDSGLRFFAGSSPRVRGTDMDQAVMSEICRFIPACAGNRSKRIGVKFLTAVHPRVCGEQDFERAHNEIHSGSSPRVRGTGVF